MKTSTRRGFMGMLAGVAAAFVVAPELVRRVIAENSTPKPKIVAIPDYWLRSYSLGQLIGNSNTYAPIDRDKTTNEFWKRGDSPLGEYTEAETVAAFEAHRKNIESLIFS